MDNALTVRRLSQAVARSRRMYRRTLANWAGDYLRFQAGDGERCRWNGGAEPIGTYQRPLVELTIRQSTED